MRKPEITEVRMIGPRSIVEKMMPHPVDTATVIAANMRIVPTPGKWSKAY